MRWNLDAVAEEDEGEGDDHLGCAGKRSGRRKKRQCGKEDDGPRAKCLPTHPRRPEEKAATVAKEVGQQEERRRGSGRTSFAVVVAEEAGRVEDVGVVPRVLCRKSKQSSVPRRRSRRGRKYRTVVVSSANIDPDERSLRNKYLPLLRHLTATRHRPRTDPRVKHRLFPNRRNGTDEPQPFVDGRVGDGERFVGFRV